LQRRLVLAGYHRTPEGPAPGVASAAPSFELWVIAWEKRN
jgi:hypothetical protein